MSSTILLVAVVVFCVVVQGWCTVAPYHEDFPKDQLVTVVQSAILRHLNRTAPPDDVSSSPPLVPSYIARHFEERRNEGPQTIAVPKNKVFACFNSNRRDCSRFKFELTPTSEGYTSVQVWFRKRNPSTRLSVSVIRLSDNETQQGEYDELSSIVTVEDRWVGFTLQDSVLEDVGDKLICVVEVSGGRVVRTGRDGPFLLARDSAPTASRERRSAGPGCDCRVVDRVLTARDLSWDHWIIAPDDLNIRACKGSCHPDQSSFNITYGRLMHNLVKNSPGLAASTQEEFWLPRCVPTKMSDMKILYRTENIVETNVKDLVIEECACRTYDCHKNV